MLYIERHLDERDLQCCILVIRSFEFKMYPI